MTTQGVKGWVGGAGTLVTLGRAFQMAGMLCAEWEVTALSPPQGVSQSLSLCHTHAHVHIYTHIHTYTPIHIYIQTPIYT